MTTDRRLKAGYQRAVNTFVHDHVYYNVSELVSELAVDEKYAEELYPVLVKDDYEEPAEDHINSMHREDIQEELESAGFDVCDSEPIEQLREALFSHLKEEEELAEFADSNNIEPYQVEAFEHWIVSDWLAARLEEKGEMILGDFLGLTIWGRATTGQSIYIDHVICDIYDELQER